MNISGTIIVEYIQYIWSYRGFWSYRIRIDFTLVPLENSRGHAQLWWCVHDTGHDKERQEFRVFDWQAQVIHYCRAPCHHEKMRVRVECEGVWYVWGGVVYRYHAPSPPLRFLTVSGDYMFKELKRRFFALIQLSQYKFILTTYSAGVSACVMCEGGVWACVMCEGVSLSQKLCVRLYPMTTSALNVTA